MVYKFTPDVSDTLLKRSRIVLEGHYEEQQAVEQFFFYSAPLYLDSANTLLRGLIDKIIQWRVHSACSGG